MGKKTLAVIGIGAGYVLARKEMKENPTGPVATAINKVTTNPTVVKAKEQARVKAQETLRQQGEAVTDKVADVIKDRLFGTSNTKTQADYIDVEVEEVHPTPPPQA
ncbi:MAG: YtxH domain-containing protein [Actinomycetaceae bacterium]|nr:YtxH domain-containing protein [Actinomycetaceae bacterium]MDU0970756.1 YtxH domain-containing protein [Actinomycetaceae bacterium]